MVASRLKGNIATDR
jgi:hypothetical protein